MIFATAVKRPLVYVMITQDDLRSLQDGRTLLVHEDQTGGQTFRGVVLSLHKDHPEILALLGQTGYDGTPVPYPAAEYEALCDSCPMTFRKDQMSQGRCINCWRKMALDRLGNKDGAP